MLLAIDIGNTSIKFGIFDGESIVSKFSVATSASVTRDQLRKAIGSNMPGACSNAIICSVVPEINAVIREFLSRDLDIESVFVINDIDFGLEFNYDPLSAVGTDRLVNAFAAVEKYGVLIIVCSFGTALTIDVVNKDREVPGGVISPGLTMLAAALHDNTSKLPKVAIEKPPSVIQNTTAQSMQSGIVYGYIGLVEGLIDRVKKEIASEPKVIATGGFAGLISQNSTIIDVVDENLLLDGLQILHSRI